MIPSQITNGVDQKRRKKRGVQVTRPVRLFLDGDGQRFVRSRRHGVGADELFLPALDVLDPGHLAGDDGEVVRIDREELASAVRGNLRSVQDQRDGVRGFANHLGDDDLEGLWLDAFGRHRCELA